MSHTPRQRHFLATLLPQLQQADWILAAWLSGSFARGDADRWSDVDLHLLVELDIELDPRPNVEQWLSSLLIETGGWHPLDAGQEMTQGITLIPEAADVTRGGVRASLYWATPEDLEAHLTRHGPIHLLFVRPSLPEAIRAHLERDRPALSAPNASAVERNLARFWGLLSRLPAALNREEHLAAAHLLDETRQTLIELVVALNGAQRPRSVVRTNPYLGPAQREAFEKTLAAREITASAWIGQAVALIVLYRWYAPQLVEMFGVEYPAALERTALALLSAEVDGWPATIRTG